MSENLENFDTRSYSDEVTATLRRLAIAARRRGHSNQQIAAILGVRPETASRWWSDYRREGEAGLPGGRTGRPPGVGRILSPEQERQLQSWITDHAPEELGVGAATWTRPAIRELIRARFGVAVAVRTVGLYLERWGFTPQRPRRRSRKADPEEVERRKNEEFPPIERRSEREDAQLRFADETGAALHDCRGRSYAPRGQTPTLLVSGDRGRVNAISSITPEGEMFFQTFSGTMNGERFVEFLRALVEFADKKVFLIADRHPAHLARRVEAWLAEHRDEIEMFHPPTHCPELNPDEYLNNNLKEALDREPLAGNASELRAKIDRFLNGLARLPERVSAYFRHPDVQYVAAQRNYND